MAKSKVAFVCVHNSCRSQMAEGFAKTLGNDLLEVYSAGTEEYERVKPLAVEVMKEINIDISKQNPKLLDTIPNDLDYLVTMGCNVSCPYLPSKNQEDWRLEDPSGGSIEDFRHTRELIKSKVIELIKRIEN